MKRAWGKVYANRTHLQFASREMNKNVKLAPKKETKAS